MTTSDFLRLVRNDLDKIEDYAREIKSRIDDSDPSVESVLHRLLSLKIRMDSLYKGVEEYASDPRRFAEEEEK